ncbi:MAG: hypothetical protein J2P25_23375 [Nocardiopsaceae bacterium]|nr:hypothetical protein [Nocardiopsaceae bacterium]
MGTTGDGYEVHPGTLRAQAATWDQAARQMHHLAANVTGLHLDHLQAGIFFPLVNKYDDVVTKITKLCGGRDGAVSVMEAIAAGLRHNADNYQEAERKNTSAAQSIGQGR